METQQITPADIGAGRIRIPARSKKAFPDIRTTVCVELGGLRRLVRWDPRLGPPARSGVLSVGREALRHIVPGTVMTIGTAEDGCYVLRAKD